MTEASNKTSGTCLCGAVSITATTGDTFGACHCGMCRKWGGAPMMAVGCGADVEIAGSESVAVYDSSPWAERGFCSKCGTHLFYRIKGSQHYQVPLGLFGDDVSPRFVMQLFIDKKPDAYTFADETETMTEAEVFAKYAPKS